MSRLQLVLTAAMVHVVLLAVVADAHAQPGRRSSGGMFGNSFQDLLRSPSVQKELKLTDDQLKQIREIGESMRDSFRDAFNGFRELTDDQRKERFDQIRERMSQARDDVEEKVSRLLSPQQRKRIKEIQFQVSIRGSTSNALLQGELSKTLKVTETQKEKLQEIRERVDRELREKIAELRKEAKEKILGVLTTEQRTQYTDLIGEPFEFRRSGGGDRHERRGEDREPGRRPPPRR